MLRRKKFKNRITPKERLNYASQRYQKNNQKTTEKKLSKPEATVEKRKKAIAKAALAQLSHP